MKGQKPDFEVYVVDDSAKKNETDKSFWVRVGSAWTGKNSISIKLNALPVNGRLVLLPPKPREAKVEKMQIFAG